MSWEGIAIGLFSLGIIGFGFFWVIRMEYYLGYLWWLIPNVVWNRYCCAIALCR